MVSTLPETTMKSITSPAPTHVWNVRSSSSIEDFYLYENMSSVNQGRTMRIEKSFPRHHVLIMASLGSACELITRDLGTATTATMAVCRQGYTAATATARVHDTRTITPFTELTLYQKHHLLSQSAMTGVLISRLMSRSIVDALLPGTIKITKTHAELTAKYIHSALACEFLVGNRYYRDLPGHLASLGPCGTQNVVGCDFWNTMKNMTPDDVSPENINAAKTELLELYAAQIDRLNDAVKQYKRGFVNLQVIRSDPEFTRLMHAYWRYSNQLMKVRSDFEENRNNGCRCGCGEMATGILDAKRIFIVSEICSVSAMVPRLYGYDIAHLFDNPGQHYGRFIKTSKQTLLRLSNDGLTAAFLSFAAVEPRMVTAEIAPKHGPNLSIAGMKSSANHIPSRHPLLGSLRVKHLQHIPRTADAITTTRASIQRSAERFYAEYRPLQDELADICAGRHLSDQSMCHMRVNTGNFVPLAKQNSIAAATEAVAAMKRHYTK